MTLKVALADDHRILREGITLLLKGVTDFELVGEAANGQDALKLVEKKEPDVLILDLMLPGLNGLEVCRQVNRAGVKFKKPKVVMLSMHANEAYVVEALRAGASAYVVKEAAADCLFQAVRVVAAGGHYISPPLSENSLGEYKRLAASGRPTPQQSLTPREREILQMTAEGLTGVDIAERLHISSRTVETHRANLMKKLRVRNQKELVRFAMENGLVVSESLPGPAAPIGFNPLATQPAAVAD